MSKATSAGFTMIELLVVVAITVMLMMTVSVFFLTFIVSSTKASLEQKIKHDGESALDQAVTMLRNARSIETCQPGMNTISFIGSDNLATTLAGSSGKFASISAITSPATTYYLTSDYSTLEPENQITFNCYTGANQQHYVDINFSLKKGIGVANNASTLIRQFSAGVNLRNNF